MSKLPVLGCGDAVVIHCADEPEIHGKVMHVAMIETGTTLNGKTGASVLLAMGFVAESEESESVDEEPCAAVPRPSAGIRPAKKRKAESSSSSSSSDDSSSSSDSSSDNATARRAFHE